MSQAGVWTLPVPSSIESGPSEATASETPDSKDKYESIIGRDGRIPVDGSAFASGSKYQSVIKTQTRFMDGDKPVWMMGTGWLIKPDLVVTAGHVVYDRSNELGEAQEIRCHIGYSGRSSVNTPSVQIRQAVKVVTPIEWLRQDSVSKDIAFIKLDRPFEGKLNLFSHAKTPLSDQDAPLVIGYPGDKSLQDRSNVQDAGSRMHENFTTDIHDVASSENRMMEYAISTYGGQSGSPVLLRGDMKPVVVGSHCCDIETDRLKTAGNAVSGQWGSDYDAYIDVLDRAIETKIGKVTLVPLENEQLSSSQIEDGILHLNASSNIGPVGISIGTLFGGPIGGAIGSVAGNVLGRLSGGESALSTAGGSNEAFSGATERAVLAEAARVFGFLMTHFQQLPVIALSAKLAVKQPVPVLLDAVKAAESGYTSDPDGDAQHDGNE